MVKLDALASDQSGKLLLLGNEAIVRGGLEGRVKVVTAYPGTPSSEIIDTFNKIASQTGVYVEYSINEKVALEVASGSAISGARALCAMKHVGLNVASDVFITLAYTGVNRGLVIISADDPSCWSSQNEQDNRYYARLANIPVLEPSNSQEAKDMTLHAFELSEKLELPILLRTTTRINHSLSPVTLEPYTKDLGIKKFHKDTSRFVMVPQNARIQHDVLLKKMKKADQISETSQYNYITRKNGTAGIITSGVSYNYSIEAADKLGLNASILKLGLTYPLPTSMIRTFMEKYDTIFVIEELEPILEQEIRSIGYGLKKPTIYGKLTGHFPRNLEYSTQIVYDGLAKGIGQPAFSEKQGFSSATFKSPPPRPPVLCPGCPHRASFYLLKTTLGKQIVYSTDIGCYALGIQPPLQIGDLLICMGSSLGTASGISKVQGEPAVAIIGDSTFFHASIPALINAVYNNHRIMIIVLDNYTTAMTGFQPHPGVPSSGTSSVEIEKVARGCGVKFVEVVDPINIKEARKVLKEAFAFEGLSLIVLRHACSVDERRQGIHHAPYRVIVDECDGCQACMKVLGCPAFKITDGAVQIDDVLCTGCGFCVHICPKQAIEEST